MLKKFTGRVAKGKTYILVDDVVTSGSTVRALKEYIENKGGKVKLVTSLATASNAQTGWGGDLAIKPETSKAIKEKFNTNQLNLLLSQYGIAEKYTDLTNSQAKYILSHRGIDRLRTKFNDARLREVSTRNGNTTDGIRGNRIKFQQLTEGSLPKGALETLQDGRVVIHALESPDFSTMVHEIGHIFEKDLTVTEQKIVKDFGGSEPFARGFEKYLRDGKSPTLELKALFDKFKER